MSAMRRHDPPRGPGDDSGAGDPNAGDLAAMSRARTDPRLFEPLDVRYHRPVFGYRLQGLQDREAAADATAQTFARALAAVRRFRSGSVAPGGSPWPATS